MKLNEILTLGIRLFAIALAIQAFRNLTGYLPYFYQEDFVELIYLDGLMIVGQLLICLGMWNYPQVVSSGLLSFQRSEQNILTKTSAEEIMAVGTTLLGIYLLFYVLSDFVYLISVWLMFRDEHGTLLTLGSETSLQMIAVVFEFIFVLFLLFGKNRLIELVHKIRYGSNDEHK